MNTKGHHGRVLKGKVLELLRSPDASQADAEIERFSARQVVNSLFSFLYSTDERIKWRAVTVMGVLVAKLADQDREWARTVVRRLMWNLNDESGGIGWGSPEAMGEILARHEGLAEEYVHILASYTQEEANYLENEVLQCGLLWGIGRLLQTRPDLVKRVALQIRPYLASRDAAVRGLAAELIGQLGDERARPRLQDLLTDDAEFQAMRDGLPVKHRVKDMAGEALRRLLSRQAGSRQ